MKPVLLYLAIPAILCSCGNNQTSSEVSMQQQPAQGLKTDTALSPVTKTEFKTRTGKIFKLMETHPQGQSLSDINIIFDGVDKSEMKFTDVEPINKVLVGDLDGNGFDELYIVTTSAGSGSYGNIIGIASNSDKSISQITFPAIEEKDLKKGGKFEGYEGHDSFDIIENSLVRTFPIKSGKATQKSNYYKLKAGEAGYLLYISR